MAARKKLSIDVDDAIRRYEAGQTLDKIASELGVSRSNVAYWFNNRGFKRRSAMASRVITIRRNLGNLSEWVERYLAGETIKSLEAASGINRRQLERAIVEQGHPLRSLRQAVGLRYSKMSVAERRSLTARANIAVRGTEKDERSLERRAITLEKTLQLASRTDLVLAMWLAQRGVAFTPQKAVGRYNIDIAIDELSVAVEVNGDWHYFADRRPREGRRLEFLLSRGWAVIEVRLPGTADTAGKYLRPACADKIVAILDEFRRDKTFVGQHMVIGGDGEPFPRGQSESYHIAPEGSFIGGDLARA